MGSAATLAAGPSFPPSSPVAFPLRASSLCPRAPSPSFVHSLISLQVQHSPSIGRIQGSGGLVNETVETTEAADDSDGDGESSADSTDEDGEEGWKAELLSELNPLLYLQPHNQRKLNRRKEISNGTPLSSKPEAEAPDWTERARQRALRVLEARNPAAAISLKKKIEPTSNGKNKRKKKKEKSQKHLVPDNSGLRNARSKISLKKLEEALRLQDDSFTSTTDDADPVSVRANVLFDGSPAADDDFDLDGIDNIDDLTLGDEIEFGRWNTSGDDARMSNNSELDRMETSKAFLLAFEHATEQGSERERNFNKQLVGAKTALEVLEIVGNAEERVRLLGLPSLLTPLNAATALHRIAKHMETSGTPKGDRLDFARKKFMAELVARSMEVLAGCLAQGLSNIAWALSKIGGNTLYLSEMDVIANAVLSKASDFNSQNVANTLGAYASMQHAAPIVFASLSSHAVDTLEAFSSQELAQVLWAHAELMQPADPLLDALDSICLSSEEVLSDSLSDLKWNAPHFKHFLSSLSSPRNSNPFGNASPEHLANLGWSYAVLDEMGRPSFKYLWQMLESILDQNVNSTSDSTRGLSTWHLSQIHQVNLCLQYGYSHHTSTLRVLLKDAAARAWEIQKHKIWSPSEYQKDVKWFLVSMGQDWVTEYTSADYSLDFALPEKKIAIEIDGPSHFIRNNGLPLGHTILKRRLLSEAGWRVLPISYEVCLRPLKALFILKDLVLLRSMCYFAVLFQASKEVFQVHEAASHRLPSALGTCILELGAPCYGSDRLPRQSMHVRRFLRMYRWDTSNRTDHVVP
ncbi:hypothetical protein GOP47_0020053 [Adiantum capillus-veneris]|uniref:RAP domain-containing protein n=1 Tax=Adiantum capillus-veneris TaxID=13818 RepID=A0A9D4UD74_ADICA|nr:hypothetical protein GOP47_0020053 [Adiantum capillus-veneris]